MPLESLDILIVLGLGLGLIRGIATGAVRQIVGFIGLIVAIVLGLELMNTVGSALGIGGEVQPVIGFIVVFLVIQILLFVGVRLVEAAMAALSLSPVNRLAGGVVGTCKAALMLSVLFLVLGFFDVPESENRERSALYEPVAAVFPNTWDYVARHLPHVRRVSDRFGKEVESALTEQSR